MEVSSSGSDGLRLDNPGLCRTCRHSRIVPGRATAFWFCRRSETDPHFPRYPRLPVLTCRGFEARAAS